MWYSGTTVSATSSGPDPVHGPHLAQTRHQAPVREQHALGQSGGAAGVQQHGVVVGADRREAIGVVEAGQPGEREGRARAGSAEGERVAYPGRGGRLARVALGQGGRGDKPPGARLGQLAGDVACRRQRVDRGDECPGGQGGVVGDRDSGLFGAVQRDPVSPWARPRATSPAAARRTEPGSRRRSAPAR